MYEFFFFDAREFERCFYDNKELIREYKAYYMDILKKGDDLRRDGLLWAVKNLIQIQINLEYPHFPKYLTHEQVDYLKNLAYIILEKLYEIGRITRKPALVLSQLSTEQSKNEPHAFVMINKEVDNPTKHLIFDVENPTLVIDGSEKEQFFAGI